MDYNPAPRGVRLLASLVPPEDSFVVKEAWAPLPGL
ncbi:hypothetical protein SAMN04515695_5378 [Pseudovibrio sp. Tun.PSC04-5.I4]|nr:hypothetical protein SAMN04515695_5378 [Pseudovibrio sp. Tun.PSC04-5.I4]